MIRLVDAFQRQKSTPKDICLQTGMQLTVPVGDFKLKGTVCHLDTSVKYSYGMPSEIEINLSLTDISFHQR